MLSAYHGICCSGVFGSTCVSGPYSVSQVGQLGSEPQRPVFQIHAPSGLAVETKRTMIKVINAAVAKAYDNLPDFLILLLEYTQDRVAINGNLNTDNPELLEELQKAH
jgi:hypothetical protein